MASEDSLIICNADGSLIRDIGNLKLPNVSPLRDPPYFDEPGLSC